MVDLSAGLSNLSPTVCDLLTRVDLHAEVRVMPPPRVLQRQVRLSPAKVDELVEQYRSGTSVMMLAREFGINRETVLEQLKRADVPRRPNVRKMTDAQVVEAARIYRDGLSLVHTAERFGVSERTIRTELARAGEPIRPRAVQSRPTASAW